MITYETGVATDPTDLLDKLAAFLSSNGWTATVPASGDYVFASGGSNSIIAGVDAQATYWQRRGATEVNAALAWDAQPGNSGVSDGMTLGAGPYTAYHFWVGDEDGVEYVHVTVEIAANSFKHWVLGNLVKYGSWGGGTYCDSTENTFEFFGMPQPEDTRHRFICDANNNTIEHAHIWVDYDGKSSPNWQRVRNIGTASVDCCSGTWRNGGFNAALANVLDQEWNLRTPLVPAVYLAKRGSFLLSPIGRIPNFRNVTINNYVAGQIVTYGSDEWMIFPTFVRYATFPGNGILSSGLYGVAHKMPA